MFLSYIGIRSKTYYVLFFVIIFSLVSTSCSNEQTYEVVRVQNKEDIQEVTVEDLTPTPKNELPADDEELAVDERFLYNLYDFTEKTSALILNDVTKGNQSYAPINWYLTLSMLSELTEGEARTEVLDALGTDDINLNQKELNKALSALEYHRLNFGRLVVKNSLWLNEDISYKEEILIALQKQYGTEIHKGIFTDTEFQDRMAYWVTENTNQEFKPDYRKANILDDPYAFISLNTLDFYNEWLIPFEEENTSTEPFYLNEDEEIPCEFMKLEERSAPFMIGDNYISTTRTLKEFESMLFILPKDGVTVEDILTRKGKLSSIISDWAEEQHSMGEVKLWVPKFDYSYEADLIQSAKALGVTRIFEINSSAFSSFANKAIYISAIKQETKIAIDEKGCSAASYTKITAQSSGVWKDKAEIYLNRPFIYVLYKDKVPFLVGVVRNPLANN